MFTALILISIGIVIGWNVPQPPWARDLQARVMTMVRNAMANVQQPGGPGPDGR